MRKLLTIVPLILALLVPTAAVAATLAHSASVTKPKPCKRYPAGHKPRRCHRPPKPTPAPQPEPLPLKPLYVQSPAAVLCNNADLECGEEWAVAECPINMQAISGGLETTANPVRNATTIMDAQGLPTTWAVVLRSNEHVDPKSPDFREQTFLAFALCIPR